MKTIKVTMILEVDDETDPTMVENVFEDLDLIDDDWEVADLYAEEVSE